MSEDLALILKLQTLDMRTSELEREIAALPKHIAEIERQLDSHKRRLEMDRAALAGNQKERKRLEDDIKVQEQKISKLRDQMVSAKTNEQYRAFQHEIDFCQNEIRKFEDRILDLMGESESLDSNVKAAEKALAEEGRQVDAEKNSARERTVADQKALAECKEQRSAAVAMVSPEAYANYERIRKRTHGIAIAEAVEGRCSVCQMSIRPQLMQELRQQKPGLMFCESCKRILYYNPPQSFEDQVG